MNSYIYGESIKNHLGEMRDAKCEAHNIALLALLHSSIQYENRNEFCMEFGKRLDFLLEALSAFR